MAQISNGNKIYQEKTSAAMIAGQGTGQVVYMDATNGNDGNDGTDPRHAVKTLSVAYGKMEAGDTLVIAPGGSETITATQTLALANIKIICATENIRSGFALTAAGTLDCLTVSGADVTIEGVVCKHTGATASAAGIKAAATAHRLTVRKCVVDDIAIVTTKTGVGVEITAGADDVVVEDSLFLDTKYDVQIAAASTAESDRPVIRRNTMFVGLSEGFGIHMACATGKIQGPMIYDNKFMEADGDGTAATAAWDGTDGTNGTQGPILMGAAVDQYYIGNNTAYSALGSSFDVLNAINAGAAGELIGNKTGAGGDVEDKVDVIDTNIDTILEASWRRVAKTAVDLTSGTADNLFTVTGEVEMYIYVNITTAIARAGGAVTLEVGTSDDTDLIVPTVTDCRGAIGDIFGGTDAAANVNTRGNIVAVSGAATTTTVLVTISAAADTGVVSAFCVYRPLSSDGAVAAA